MELSLFWTEFAKSELEKIFQYYKKRASAAIAKKLIIAIYNKTLDLQNQPQKGQIEELLIGRNQEFRYLVCKNYKIIYWVNEAKQQVEIFDVFDTRQNPRKIKRSKK